MLLEKDVSKASIAKIVGVSSSALRHFTRTRKLATKAGAGNAILRPMSSNGPENRNKAETTMG